MFYPLSSPAGAAGTYGHSLGVNWVWVPMVMLIHMVFSIGIPILLFGLALPEFRRKSLLSGRGVAIVIAILALDIAVLMTFVSRLLHFWMGDEVLAGALIAVAGLCAFAYVLPKDLVRPLRETHRYGLVTFAAAGSIFYVGFLVLAAALEYWRVPVLAVTLTIPLYAGLLLVGVLRGLGSIHPERPLLALTGGLLLPIAVIGLISQITLPFVVVEDVLLLFLLRHLFRKYPSPVPWWGSSPDRLVNSSKEPSIG